tara:strand:- start:1315 stop:1581 length:267 start_codon:yes stop_codon:yes gene_type:complete
MSLASAARTAKNLGVISWAFEKTLKLVRGVGRKGYEIITDKPKYEVEIMVGDTNIEVRDKVSSKELNDLLKAMKTMDHVTLIVKSFKV